MTNYNTYTDSELFDMYSDSYKDVNGIRPVYTTRENMIHFFEYYHRDEVIAEMQKQWDNSIAWMEEYELKMIQQEKEKVEQEKELLESKEYEYYWELEQSVSPWVYKPQH